MTLTPYMPPTQVFIRIKPGNIQASLSIIENTWKKFVSNYPFHYEFLDDVFRRQYNDEKKTRTILQYFSTLAIFISCIGLFGLAVFVTQRRNKEIGIRKIAGANILEITGLIFQDFAKWLLFAIFFSIPIAYFVMHKWLQNFAYKTELSWWIFALAGLLALGIAILTVSIQGWKAATRNPVEALRYE
jgi:putative ABC transport system permease protein